MDSKPTRIQQDLVNHLEELGDWLHFEEAAKLFPRLTVYAVIDKGLALYEDGFVAHKSLRGTMERERTLRLDQLMRGSTTRRLHDGYALLIDD